MIAQTPFVIYRKQFDFYMKEVVFRRTYVKCRYWSASYVSKDDLSIDNLISEPTVLNPICEYWATGFSINNRHKVPHFIKRYYLSHN